MQVKNAFYRKITPLDPHCRRSRPYVAPPRCRTLPHISDKVTRRINCTLGKTATSL